MQISIPFSYKERATFKSPIVRKNGTVVYRVSPCWDTLKTEFMIEYEVQK